MASDDLEYFRHRADTERALAKAADRADVAAIHEELAKQYEALIAHAELRVISPFRLLHGELAAAKSRSAASVKGSVG